MRHISWLNKIRVVFVPVSIHFYVTLKLHSASQHGDFFNLFFSPTFIFFRKWFFFSYKTDDDKTIARFVDGYERNKRRKKRKLFLWRGKGKKFMKQMQINWLFCAHGNQKKQKLSETIWLFILKWIFKKTWEKNRLKINKLNCCLKLFMQMNESVVESWILNETIENVIKRIAVYVKYWLKNKYDFY